MFSLTSTERGDLVELLYAICASHHLGHELNLEFLKPTGGGGIIQGSSFLVLRFQPNAAVVCAWQNVRPREIQVLVETDFPIVFQTYHNFHIW